MLRKKLRAERSSAQLNEILPLLLVLGCTDIIRDTEIH